VGGDLFTILLFKFPKSDFTDIIKNNEYGVDKSGRIFIDRNPRAFSAILEYLRTKILSIPRDIPINQFKEECVFYGIDQQEEELRLPPDNIAEQFYQLALNKGKLYNEIKKTWRIIHKEIITQLAYEPTYTAEIEWITGNLYPNTQHNHVNTPFKHHPSDIKYTKNSYYKIDISWKDETKNCYVEHWERYLSELGFKILNIEKKTNYSLRFTWIHINNNEFINWK